LVLRYLTTQYIEDERLREAIGNRVAALRVQAKRLNRQLPELLGDESTAEITAKMIDAPLLRKRVLDLLIDTRKHADDLAWESRFIDGVAEAEPQLIDKRDQYIAEGEFRTGMTLPLAGLVWVLAVRENPWFLVAGLVPIWMFYMGQLAFAHGDQAVLRAVSGGKLVWPVARQVLAGPLHFRELDQVTRRTPGGRSSGTHPVAGLTRGAEHAELGSATPADEHTLSDSGGRQPRGPEEK
jgi:hypothetical protein